MNADVPTAFEMLLEAMNGEKVHLADAVREATLQGRFDEAQRLLARTQYLERLVGQVRQLRGAWDQLESGALPTVDLGPPMVRELAQSNDATARYRMIKEPMPSDDDQNAPELELVDRLFGTRRSGRRQRRQPVDRTPQSEYRVPILEALEELGGAGHVTQVLRIVYRKMKDRLTKDDLERLPSGGDYRWRNTAQWERKHMIGEGLLRDDSPKGVWEMTEAGRAYLEQVRQQGGEEHEP
uniref:Hypothetical conserved protein n=1 Tax=uncultured prokaryote TaxID=198431 RepID=H5SCN1_9ZZZZ|nr:hypothetical conserved protein [uncultured prokaryote]